MEKLVEALAEVFIDQLITVRRFVVVVIAL